MQVTLIKLNYDHSCCINSWRTVHWQLQNGLINTIYIQSTSIQYNHTCYINILHIYKLHLKKS